jgi:lipid II:glycine glycyltransferase (peptidoglycan interpeptide bridge formation enzyme)
MLTSNICAPGGTFFSQENFIQAVARAEIANVRVLKLQSTNSPAHLYGLEYIRTHNRRSVSLAPFGLPAYPIGDRRLDKSIPSLLEQLKTLRTVDFEWNVRFDHYDLAKCLADSALNSAQCTTHVLFLDRPYENLFRKYSETARNKVRRAERSGVVVDRALDDSEVEAYYSLYHNVATERPSWSTIYKRSLFDEIFQVKDFVILLTVKFDGKLIGGGWFIRDGDSLFYWQGVMNYAYKRYFPHYALIDSAIRYASKGSMVSFNMGASLGVATLEQFKSFWGARKVPCWTFVWRNPVWRSVARIRRAIQW